MSTAHKDKDCPVLGCTICFRNDQMTQTLRYDPTGVVTQPKPPPKLKYLNAEPSGILICPHCALRFRDAKAEAGEYKTQCDDCTQWMIVKVSDNESN